MTVFEDKLRLRIVTSVGYHAHDRAISMTEAERDALADALTALRELHRVSGGLGEGEQWQAADAALARLDNA